MDDSDGPLLLDDARADALWRLLSDQLSLVRSGRHPSCLNDVLLEQARALGDVPLTAVFRGWAADNLAMEKRYRDAIALHRQVLEDYGDARFLGNDLGEGALEQAALCHQRLGETDEALDAFQRLAKRHKDDSAWALYQAARVAESAGRTDTALAAYDAAARASDPLRQNLFAIPDLAQRAASRLRHLPEGCYATPEEVASQLVTALRRKDTAELKRLASPTHFTVGPAGGCRAFVDPGDFLDRLRADLAQAEIHVDAFDLEGEGGKRYVDTRGWTGQWLFDSVYFLITQSPQGWEWSGVVLLHPTPGWLDEWEPEVKATNQPLPFGLSAPWPADQSFKAGGIKGYVAEQIALIAVPPLFRELATVLRSLTPCGFGLRGFYYNFGPTHQGLDAFAIDFTRYRRGLPYSNASKGTDVLAVRTGVVSRVHEAESTGSPTTDNRVFIQHEHQGVMHYESRYRHFTGPNRIRVSRNQYVRTGTVLGQMDDTGNSALHHLHFSMHDTQNGWSGVRPTPMAGERLDDQDGGKCIRSRTRPYRGWSFSETPPPPLEP